MNTPKQLTDLQYQSNVIRISEGNAPETTANRFFHELFDPLLPVSIHLLFQEEGHRVYECYQDSGSEEYLYIDLDGEDTMAHARY